MDKSTSNTRDDATANRTMAGCFSSVFGVEARHNVADWSVGQGLGLHLVVG